MRRVVLRAKIHRATVTDADLDYEGSCSLGPELLLAADIVPGEQVHVVNVTNGSRAITYAIEGKPRQVGLNGAMAHIGGCGDVVIVIAYAQMTDAELMAHSPRVVLVDADNRVRDEVAVS
ncbi:MAG: aspartate 1-decarboxylase [Candidatus Dormibacteraeota bacterium]|uniref:Aspartate 1-decarboxylase n=1 Tax=Candidatus Aeolococcus gillhamiae TaxID=3127015 RepID=A0A2W5YZN2_9BACT|nr:aspartate 1-decarboxylase [Candidatus Dormibacteraeota bacterium]PZR78300.1 MAG: aspartate 1-decarboxylase [Candidatus Dormibacter sp. RRmetagenome_bin12]